MIKRDKSSLEIFADSIIRRIKEFASIIWVKSCDKEHIYDIISMVVTINQNSIYSFNIEPDHVSTWNIANGKVMFGKSPKDNSINQNLSTTIKNFSTSAEEQVLIIDDISKILEEHKESNEIIGLLQEFAYYNTKWSPKRRKLNQPPQNKKCIIIISPRLEIAENIKHLVEVIEEPIPDPIDIARELGFDKIEEQFNTLRGKELADFKKTDYCTGRYKYSASFMQEFDSISKKIVASLNGMYLYQIRRLLYSLQVHGDSDNLALQTYVSSARCDLHVFISNEKKRLVQNSGLLQVIDIDYERQKDRVGNINNLRKVLDSQKEIINNIENYNPHMPKPKGVLLVGAPGCGKSEAAKSVAAILEKPLLRLDIGALMGQYVGVSEHNLIEAIRTAEAAAPCVLWIDEIEKAFAGFSNSDGDNDITVMRMVGYFLTWMQERKSLVYLVATANSLDNLRPELLRKGRWDKIMYLSYPDMNGIVDIFTRCLNKYRLKLDVSTKRDFGGKFESPQFEKLVSTIFQQEMSGADIDAIIIEAYNIAFISSKARSMPIKCITVEDCQKIVDAAHTLQARKEADDELVAQGLRNFKISSGRFNWDLDKGERLRRAINDYRMSSGTLDYTQSIDEMVNDAIANIKISSGQTNLRNEEEIKNLIRNKVKKAKKHDNEILQIIREKVEESEQEKETITQLLKEQLSHKNREEQEKYYRTKGYEPAS